MSCALANALSVVPSPPPPFPRIANNHEPPISFATTTTTDQPTNQPTNQPPINFPPPLTTCACAFAHSPRARYEQLAKEAKDESFAKIFVEKKGINMLKKVSHLATK